MSIDRPMFPPRAGSPNLAEGLSRRLMLAGLAALLAALPAVAAEPDPIYAVIEQHRKLAAHYSAAVDVSSRMVGDDPGLEAAEQITGERCDALLDFADDELIGVLPTTLAGIIALARYMAGIPEWQQPRDHVRWEIDGVKADWHAVLLHTVADALDNITADREISARFTLLKTDLSTTCAFSPRVTRHRGRHTGNRESAHSHHPRVTWKNDAKETAGVIGKILKENFLNTFTRCGTNQPPILSATR